MTRSNCLREAFRHWFRAGGQFAFEPSAHGPFPHVVYRAPGSGWTEFDPVVAKYRHRWPPLRFLGRWHPAWDRAPFTESFGLQADGHRLAWTLWLIVLCGYFTVIVLSVGWAEIWRRR